MAQPAEPIPPPLPEPNTASALEEVRDRGTKEAFDPRLRVGWKVCEAALEFGVRIRPIGRRIYLFKYRSPDGRQRKRLFGNRVPCAARLAPSGPLRVIVAAFGTAVHRPRARHYPSGPSRAL